MAMITKSIVIEAPVKQVFSYLDEPVNLPEIWPSMIEVKDVTTLPAGGYRFHWLYKMAGMQFEGDAETIEFELNRHILRKSTGKFPQHVRLHVHARGRADEGRAEGRVRAAADPARQVHRALRPQAERA